MENTSIDSSPAVNSLERLSASLSHLRVMLTGEVKRRQAIIKPLEQLILVLKDPHRNAIALYEATSTLSKMDRGFLLATYLDTILKELRQLAEEQLSELELRFARDLAAVFAEREITLAGLPHELTADLFVIKIDFARREVQLTFAKQPVTDKKIKLDIDRVLSAYLRAKREICQRNIDPDQFLRSLFEAYQRLVKVSEKSVGARIPIVDCYRELVLIKQPDSFYKSPSKLSFVDYPKTHFIFDMLQLRQADKLEIDGYRLHLAATKFNVAADSTRALFLTTGARQGQFIKDIYFTAEKQK